MTELARILGLAALVPALLLPIAKREKELAQAISGLLYLTVFIYAMTRLGSLAAATRTLLAWGGSIPHAEILLQAVGISLLTAAASALCAAHGQQGTAHAIELLGVIEVMLSAQPILTDIFDIAEKILLK